MSTPRRTERSQPNLYRRGSVYWGRIWVRGREVRWSLRTADEALARQRVEDRRRSEFAGPPSDHLDERWNHPFRQFGQLNGSIYFIWHADRVKIGYSKNIAERLPRLQTGHSERLHLLYACPGNKKMEGALHELFDAERLKGEWFRLSRRIFEWIAARHD